ncbi:unnamed protein product [Owenia fusiformis]|uniref:Nuclear pore complex protein Nup85 n=1 Tax=Owenia fusiformis TaxID=6347 RepID=A0A8J1XYZ3_OWEFU|nr:unnamed protein product [Owenia fusiformis]
METMAEREEEPEVTVINDPACSIGIKTTWGFGNQLFLFAGKETDKLSDPEGATGFKGATHIYEVVRDTDMHDPITRKLVNESHNIFLNLQKFEPESAGASKKPQLVKFSRNYRCVIRSCLQDLMAAVETSIEPQVKQKYEAQLQLFDLTELVWSLCEILFVDTLPGGVIVIKLLDWLRWHFTDGERQAQDAMKEDVPEENENYWQSVWSFVLQGRIDDARKMLSVHRSYDTPAFQSIDELLRKMPIFTSFTGQSLAEFDMKWRHWRDECRRRLEENEYATNKNLNTICRILSGDDDVFIELRDVCASWYHMMVSKLLYQDPTVKIHDLQYHTQSCINAFGGNSQLQPSDNILLAAIEFDIPQVINLSSTYKSNWWFVAHLTDLLQHCGQLESRTLHFGSNLREYLILEYASSLMSHDSLWQIGINYLDHCPEYGRQYLGHYMDSLPLDTERKAQKALRICEQRNLQEQGHSICKVMGMRSLHNGRLGSALSWGLKSKDVTFVTFIAERFLDEYTENGGFSNVDLIDNLGSEMLLSNRLTFLGKYREFHKLYEDGDFIAAASLLLSLLSSRMAPRKFWLTLLTDALPLLERDQVVFNSQQTYELMHCLEELNLAQRYSDKPTRDMPDDPKAAKGQTELEKEKSELMKLALARNLARAIVEEGSEI